MRAYCVHVKSSARMYSGPDRWFLHAYRLFVYLNPTHPIIIILIL